MTRIREIAAIKDGVTVKESLVGLNQRAANVKRPAQVDTSNLSAGEMQLYLLAQRQKMIAEFWQGTPLGLDAQVKFESMRDALYKGLHTSIGLNHLPQRMRSAPASGWQPWEKKARTPKQGIKNLFDDAPTVVHIGEIPLLDCDTLWPNLTEQDLLNSNVPSSLWSDIIQQRNDDRQACKTENEWRESLNTYWEDSGHSFIYEFLQSNTFPHVPFDAAQKSGRHGFFVENISKASKISRSNIRIWQENGIIYHNIQGRGGQSLGPIGAVEFIEGLRNAAINDAQGTATNTGIGGFPLALIPVAAAVLAHTFNQAKRFFDVLTGEQTLQEALSAHIGDVKDIVEQYADDVYTVATTDDWRCEPDFKYENGICVPDDTAPPPPPLPPGGGTSLQLSPEIMVGGGLLLGVLLFSGNNNSK